MLSDQIKRFVRGTIGMEFCLPRCADPLLVVLLVFGFSKVLVLDCNRSDLRIVVFMDLGAWPSVVFLGWDVVTHI